MPAYKLLKISNLSYVLNNKKNYKKLLLYSEIIDNILIVGWYETQNLINCSPN